MLFGILPDKSATSQHLPKKYLIPDLEQIRFFAVPQHVGNHESIEQKVELKHRKNKVYHSPGTHRQALLDHGLKSIVTGKLNH